MLHFKYCMKKIALLFFTGILAIASLGIQSCVKKGTDEPESQTNVDPKLTVTHTIAQLLALPKSTKITGDVVISGVVVMDDRSGNYYKKFVIQDETGGIEINLDQNNIYNDYPVGRKVYLKCKDLMIIENNGTPQLGTGTDDRGSIVSIPFVMADEYIIKANYPNEVKVDTLTYDELANTTTGSKYVNRLVLIKDVEFGDNAFGLPFADANTTTNRDLKGCGASGSGIVVRTSNYSRFRGAIIPSGSGFIYGIYTVYGSTPQLIVRDQDDVIFKAERCDGTVPSFAYILFDQFTDFGNWSNVNVTGAEYWKIATFGNPRPCAVITGYTSGTNNENEDWLISKPLSLTGFDRFTLTFETAARYGGNDLECLVSTNYTDGNPNAATWAPLSGTLADVNGSSFVWTPSGDIDLSTLKGNTNVRIAFKYTSTTSQAPTWELDNVKVKGE